MKRKAIILHSGGLDSTVCLLLALEGGREAISLGVDYNQKSRAELECAARLCDRFNIARKVLKVEWDKPERYIPMDRTVADIRREVSPAFLPGRNALFLTLGCAEAAGMNASEVWVGINSVDYSGYPDCRPEFVEQFQMMIDVAIPDGVKIVAPLISMSKPEIAKEAYRLGIRQGDTWSCYRPQAKDSGFEPCGQCDACVLHKYAWEHVEK
jgi:7-cyano-7-deazaguanine synthase